MTTNVKAASAIGALAILAGAGCGGASEAPTAAGDASRATDRAQVGSEFTELAAATSSKSRRKTTIRLEDSDYGRVLFDGKGRALYLFTADGRHGSNCHDACAEAWPPLIARGELRARGGARAKLLGTTKRGKRRQVTYDGHPLYRYVDDPRHEILCHDVSEFGGDWLVVRASGRPAP